MGATTSQMFIVLVLSIFASPIKPPQYSGAETTFKSMSSSDTVCLTVIFSRLIAPLFTKPAKPPACDRVASTLKYADSSTKV